MTRPDTAAGQRGRGTPTRYTIATARAICQRLARGEPLTLVCADPAMPAYRTVMDWLAARPRFREMYAQARVLQAHALADEILQVLRCDRLPPADKQARIKGLAWLAAKLHPQKYGDRSGPAPDGAPAPGFTVIVNPPAIGAEPLEQESDDE
ncbi:MAG: hypothetical protein HZA24_11820 [Nitrospirae bacterium]|nr:hypothetical protein [Nitrospirota bacterium]